MSCYTVNHILNKDLKTVYQLILGRVVTNTLMCLFANTYIFDKSLYYGNANNYQKIPSYVLNGGSYVLNGGILRIKIFEYSFGETPLL